MEVLNLDAARNSHQNYQLYLNGARSRNVQMYKCTKLYLCKGWIWEREMAGSVLAACQVTTKSAALWLEKALHRFQEKGEGESDKTVTWGFEQWYRYLWRKLGWERVRLLI